MTFMKVSQVIRNIGSEQPMSVTDKRIELGLRIQEATGERIIRYGPFKGMKLDQYSSWGKADLGSTLLGMYEEEVASFLHRIRDKKKTFVDVGSAEGLYSVGVLQSQLFGLTISFEMSESSRQIQHRNAQANGVSERIKIFGKAEASFLDLVEQSPGFSYEDSVFLFDIEGAEIDLITKDNLQRMRRATVIVETHPMFVDFNKQLEFESLLSGFHEVSELRIGPRDPSQFTELQNWSDDDRWAVCSEGRARAGRWLVLLPKSD
jgi:hypothetical protein